MSALAEPKLLSWIALVSFGTSSISFTAYELFTWTHIKHWCFPSLTARLANLSKKLFWHCVRLQRRMNRSMADQDRLKRILLSNKAQCRKCGDVIESKYVHDFVYCSCKAIAVDGGLEYLRRVGDLSNIIELSEYAEEREQDVQS